MKKIIVLAITMFFLVTLLPAQVVSPEKTRAESGEIRIVKNNPHLKSKLAIIKEKDGIFQEMPELDRVNATWSESTNFLTSQFVYIGPGHYFLPDLYVRSANFRLCFQTVTVNARMEISYNGGSSWTVLRSSANVDSGWVTLPWTSMGGYTLKIKYLDMGANWNYFTFNVYVVPDIGRKFVDTNGNSMYVWPAGSSNMDKPAVVVEGFDPSNENYPELYYYLARNMISKTTSQGSDFIFLNFADGGADMRNNAVVVDEAVRYINGIKSGSTQTILAGLSMGGVVARYALAKAEHYNNSLNVSHFLSIDSPHQYAVFDKNLIDFIKDEGDPTPLESIAAKQLLFYNSYDPNNQTANSMHNQFHSQLDALNGDGYPHIPKTIGVSFSPNTTNPNSGTWLEIVAPLWYGETFSLDATGARLREPGSYLPLSSTNQAGVVGWGLPGWYFDRQKNPTFIPHDSALDKTNGVSKFDVAINSATHNYHDVLPADVIDPILDELGLLPPLTAYISGPSSISKTSTNTWTCNASGGYPGYSYQWQRMKVSTTVPLERLAAEPADYWFNVGTNSSTYTMSPPSNGDYRTFKLKCRVTDSNGNITWTGIKTVSYY